MRQKSRNPILTTQNSAFLGSQDHGLGTNGFEVSLNYITGVPDVNLISDPELKIIFKSLLKKYETTKERLLIDLREEFSDESRIISKIDDVVLISWTQLFPKLAIDVSKNVRLNAYQTQGVIVKTLGKKYAKYLKDTAPAWLAGNFDTERLVSRAANESLLNAFSSQDKVDLLWKLFATQSLNYCYQVLKFESKDTLSDERNTSKDEREAQFTRVLLGAVELFTRLISSEEIDTNKTESFTLFLHLEELWDHTSTKDLSLKKSLLMLAVSIFKKHPELVDSKLFKLMSKAIIKSIKYKPQTNNIVYSSIALPTLSALLHLSSYSSDFWTVSGKKTREKFLAFIELGSCSSSEIYYDLLLRILLKLPKSFIDIAGEDYQNISKILEEDLLQERLAPFKHHAAQCFFSIQSEAFKDLQDLVSENLSTYIPQYLSKRVPHDTLGQVVDFYRATNESRSLTKVTELALDQLKSDSKPQLTFLQNVFDILNRLRSDKLDELVKRAFGSVEDLLPVPNFVIFSKIITSNVTKYKFDIDTLLKDELLSLVEKNFIEEPLNLLVDYNNNDQFLDVPTLNESFNSLFVKVLMLDESLNQVVLGKLTRLTKVDVESCKDVKSFILNKSAGVDFQDEADKKSNILNFVNKDVFKNLFNSAVDSSSELIFVKEFLAKFDGKVLHEFLADDDDSTVGLFLNYIFKTCDKPDSIELFKQIGDDNVVLNNLKAYVSSAPVELAALVTVLTTYKPNLVHELLGQDTETWFSQINTALGNNVDLRLSIANSLGGTVFLASHEFHPTLNFTKSLQLIFYSRFILSLLRLTDSHKSSDLVIVLGMVAELAADYCFLTEEDTSDVVMDLVSDLRKLVNQNITLESDLNEIVDAFIKETKESEKFKALTSHINEASLLSFYANRVFETILSNIMEKTSLQEFENLDINYNKLLKTPLKFSSFFVGSKKFITSPSLDRIRNVVASEMFHLNANEILDRGLKNLTLLQNFILTDSSIPNIETYEPIQEQRLIRIVNSLSNWLDSDVVFEDQFIPVRIQMMSFVTNYLSLPGHSKEIALKLLDVGLSIFRGSIGVLSLEDSDENLSSAMTTLRYFSLKFFILLNKHKSDIPAWADEIDEIYEEIVQTLHAQKDSDFSHPLSLADELYFKIFNGLVPMSYLKIDDFYKLLSAKGGLQRLGVSVLYKIIIESQQDFVIEYELSKSKLSPESSEESLLLAQIPQNLVSEILHVPEEFLEFEDVSKMNRYLWGWLLIFAYFKDVTQRIRHDYIKQLCPEFEKLFNFIFDQIDLNSDLDFIKRLSQQDLITVYDIDSSINGFESTIEEQKLLIIHLFYLSIANVGSLVQTWFNSIRNRQLKTSIERLSINYISPIVINEELDKAASLIEKNNFDTENFTIKINRLTHEIKSMYLIDEKTMEMVIRIPNSYPLQNVVVEGPVRLGVKENQWKSWLLASQRIIASQSSTIVGAIELFNKNVSLHFSGFEECAICYSILHYQDKSLPSKNCTTCNNKFHAACLYKWFKSSGGSTCPLCRSSFNFRK